VSARFDALGDNEVTAGINGGSCLIDRAHLPAHQGALLMSDVDELRIRIEPEAVDHPHVMRGVSDRVGIKVGQQEVDGEHTAVRSTTAVTSRSSAGVGMPSALIDPTPPASATATASPASTTLPIGAC
jgi:hypothetical protein